MPLLCPVINQHYRLTSNPGLDAVDHDGSVQRVSHDTYDLNDTSHQKEQRDAITDYSECLLIVTVLASPWNLFTSFRIATDYSERCCQMLDLSHVITAMAGC